MSFFKDSSIDNKPALFICKDKDDRDTKATTLIVRPPMIGYFSKKWESWIRPSNLLEWSTRISHGLDTSSRITILLASHHTNSASSRLYSSLGQDIIEKQTNWEFSFNVNGEVSYMLFYWEWLEDVLSRCEPLLDKARLYDAVYASLFTYDRDDNIIKALYECWSQETNTFHTSIGEISITPWDLYFLGGLPCTGTLHYEVVSSVEELTGVDQQGQHFLPPSYHYLFLAYRHLQNRIKRQGKVSIND